MERMEYRAFIGLGSNVASSAGDPRRTIRAAIAALEALGELTAQSSLYRTTPVGFLDQPDFINAVVCLETDVEPEELMRELLGIERRFGRDRSASVPKGPRTLDLDLLLVFETANGESVVHRSAGLTLPHPEMARRRFVLEPLAEIAPELRHPLLCKSARQLLDKLPKVEAQR
jgi:2-amino-4-hydroxy-6-hydroxymethyldihydropteridine diphosphokinase